MGEVNTAWAANHLREAAAANP